MKKLCKALFTALLCVAFLSQCADSTKKGAEIPELKDGKATFSGKIINNSEKTNIPKSLQLTISNPITGIPQVEKIEIDSASGSFSKEISILTSGIAFMQSTLFKGAIPLLDGETTEMSVTIHPNDSISADYKSSTGITFDGQKKNTKAILNSFQFINEMITNKGLYKMPLNEYKTFITDTLNKKIEQEYASTEIGQYLKGIGSRAVRLNLTNNFFFNYSYIAGVSHFYSKDSVENFKPQVFSKDNFSFLKDLDLNNAEYLKADKYSDFIRSMLTNKELNIPTLDTIPLTIWMDSLQHNLKDLVGFKSGMFYDLLASNAYAMQLVKLKPLTAAQKTDIENYFGNKTIAKTLFALDADKIKEAEEKRILVEKIKKISPLHLNETPQVEANKIIETIVAKHKGKVVFLDFWATWCGPCIWAMGQANPVKMELADKDIVYIYITNPSSPKEKWESMYPEIGGEHYYVTDAEWKVISKQFEMKGIPHYRIFDKKGKEKYKSTGFMGVDNMRKWLLELQ